LFALARLQPGLFEVFIEEKSLSLVLDGDVGVEVEADRMILKQALVNIIHNAVNYSPDGETVVVRVLNRDAHQVTVEIEDHGPGIPRAGECHWPGMHVSGHVAILSRPSGKRFPTSVKVSREG
jgi:signal transduction histidine kinase